MKESLKIVIVDDDDVQLLVVKAWLESQGHQVITRNGPLGTSGLLVKERPDVVILDVVMPGLSGDALAVLLGRVASSVRLGVIFYSAQAAPPIAHSEGIPILGAIRKTHKSAEFLAQFRVLTSARAPALARTATDAVLPDGPAPLPDRRSR